MEDLRNGETLSVPRKALVLTVGTGNQENLEKSLYKPLQMSIDKGEWNTVILLPSQDTKANAEHIQATVNAEKVICICKPLESPEMHTNADECFGHFDRILGELIDHGFDKADITLDFTRGTKAMSAALLMAGMSREITNVRYVSGSRRDQTGSVIADTEQIVEVNTRVVNARRLLNQSERLIRQGSFEAVDILLKETLPTETSGYLNTIRIASQRIEGTAEVYSAWDRFDYKNAIKYLENDPNLLGTNSFAPTPAMCKWLEALATGIDPRDKRAAAIYIQRLACDVLANAERRIRDGLYEDAYVRNYRVLELIGQYCLFEKGYDSGKLPLDDEIIIQFEGYLEEKKSAVLGRRKIKGKSFATAGRLQVARLINYLEDPRGQKLIHLGDKRDGFLAKNRNTSLLFHGFAAAGTGQEKYLKDSIGDLEEFLLQDFPQAEEYLDVARSINFSSE